MTSPSQYLSLFVLLQTNLGLSQAATGREKKNAEDLCGDFIPPTKEADGQMGKGCSGRKWCLGEKRRLDRASPRSPHESSELRPGTRCAAHKLVGVRANHEQAAEGFKLAERTGKLRGDDGRTGTRQRRVDPLGCSAAWLCLDAIVMTPTAHTTTLQSMWAAFGRSRWRAICRAPTFPSSPNILYTTLRRCLPRRTMHAPQTDVQAPRCIIRWKGRSGTTMAMGIPGAVYPSSSHARPRS